MIVTVQIGEISISIADQDNTMKLEDVVDMTIATWKRVVSETEIETESQERESYN